MEADRQIPSIAGAVEVVFRGQVQGWVWNADEPDARLTVVIRVGETVIAEVKASNFRDDLASAGLGDGRYGFAVSTDFAGDHEAITVEVKGSGYKLPVESGANRPLWLNPDDLPDAQINLFNLDKMRRRAPARYFYIRLDTNLDCNLHCVYCHNPRSRAVLDPSLVKDFLDKRVISVENFQFGCAMEPTLDPRLIDFMVMVANSPAKPKNIFQLQTNGILLHRHDFQAMKAAGLTSLSVSLDSVEPETQKLLRSGTSLRKVLSNVGSFLKHCPGVEVQFITTVTSANIGKLCDIVRSGTDLGVTNFAFREVFYDPLNNIVDHSRMPELMLKSGKFTAACSGLKEEFPDTRIEFFDTDSLFAAEARIKADSSL